MLILLSNKGPRQKPTSFDLRRGIDNSLKREKNQFKILFKEEQRRMKWHF